MTAKAVFREADLTRALRAAKKVGIGVRVEIEPGRMVVTTTKDRASAGGNPLDEMFA